MPTAPAPRTPTAWPLRLTTRQWVTLSIEVHPFRTLAAKVNALYGADAKVLLLAPVEVEVLRRLLAGWLDVRGSSYARRCRQVHAKVLAVQARIGRGDGC